MVGLYRDTGTRCADTQAVTTVSFSIRGAISHMEMVKVENQYMGNTLRTKT